MPVEIRYDAGFRFDDPLVRYDSFYPDPPINTVMPTDNRISATITPANKSAVTASLASIRTTLNFLVNLTEEERKRLPKIKDKTAGFDIKAANYMTARPDLVPGFVNVAELAKDRSLMTDLSDIIRDCSMLLESLQDTLMLAGSETLMAELSFYQNVRQASQRGVVGADTIYNDLKLRFPGRSPAPPTPPTP